MKKVLLIGGSDTCAGAGIQVDLKAVTAFGVYGTTVVTALTAQNTLGVQDVYPVPPAFVAQQIDSVMKDIGTDALKTGMLLDKDTVRVVADKINEYGISKVVIDPVILAKGGRPLLNKDALEVLKSALIPLSLLITPNIPEAERLAGISIGTATDLQEAARRLHGLGARNVLIKGGHFTGETAPATSGRAVPASGGQADELSRNGGQAVVQDLLYDGKGFTFFASPRVTGVTIHGSGCVLASSICAGLAKGYTLLEAIRTAREFLLRAMQHPLRIGKGHEVINFKP